MLAGGSIPGSIPGSIFCSIFCIAPVYVSDSVPGSLTDTAVNCPEPAVLVFSGGAAVYGVAPLGTNPGPAFLWFLALFRSQPCNPSVKGL